MLTNREEERALETKEEILQQMVADPESELNQIARFLFFFSFSFFFFLIFSFSLFSTPKLFETNYLKQMNELINNKKKTAE